jgi:hypothetical protein
MITRWSADHWLRYLSDWKIQIDGTPESEMYDFDLSNKSNLLITAGCSWTRGGSLDPDLRKTQVYGALISKKLNYDWINLGLSGWSNAHILLTVQQVIDRLSKDDSYQKIVVVITLTENAREIRSAKSYPFDYRTFLKNNPGKDFFPNLLDQFENDLIAKLMSLVDSVDARFEFIVGQSTVKYPRLSSIAKNQLSIVGPRWIDILAEKQHLTAPPTESKICYGWNISSLEMALEIAQAESDDLQDAKIIILDMIEKYEKLHDWFQLSVLNDPEKKHPTAKGQKLWADHLTQFIKS